MKKLDRKDSWSGAFQIVRFNWPSYAIAVAVIIGAAIAARASSGGGRFVCFAVLAITFFWSAASILVSHWIYDLSPLADWRWISSWLPSPAGRWVAVQAGFDASHGALSAALDSAPEAVVDLYGAAGVGGGSVRRARAENAGSVRGGELSALPKGPSSYDAILAVFSLHEIHDPDGRAEFFAAACRALKPGGRFVVVEHLRDLMNFTAFGPGFLHFLPESEWFLCAARAEFRLEKTTSLTPFVRAYCWRRP